jgi:hypothetical protein
MDSSVSRECDWIKHIFSNKALFRKILGFMDFHTIQATLWRACKTFEAYLNDDASMLPIESKFLMDSIKCLKQSQFPTTSNDAPSTVVGRYFFSVSDIAAGKMVEVSRTLPPGNNTSSPTLKFSRVNLPQELAAGKTYVHENMSTRQTEMKNELNKDSTNSVASDLKDPKSSAVDLADLPSGRADLHQDILAEQSGMKTGLKRDPISSATSDVNPKHHSKLFLRRQISHWPDGTEISPKISISLLTTTDDSKSTLEPAHIFSMIVQPSALSFKKSDFIRGFESFPSNHLKFLKTLMLYRVVLDKSLVEFINSISLKVLYLNDCYIREGEENIIKTIKNLKRLYFAPCLKFPNTGRIRVPEQLEELVIYCPRSKDETKNFVGPQFDLIDCLSLKCL